MCCLKHEQDVYEEKLAKLPNVGAFVNTPDGKGVVDDVQVLKELVTVRVENGDDKVKKTYEAKDIEILKNTKKKEKRDEDIDMRELKQLEEGFKRIDDI